MPRRKSVFSQQDVVRALRAAQAAGLEVSGYEIEPETGKIFVRLGAPSPTGTTQGAPQSDLEKWLARGTR